MFPTVWATIQDGRIQLSEPLELQEGTKLLVTVIPDDDEARFWTFASQTSLAALWDHAEDDVYAQLLEE